MSKQLSVIPFKNDYSLLQLKPTYDADKVRQFSMAANERTILLRRVKELETLMKDNSELALWTTTKPSGEVVAIPDMDAAQLSEELEFNPTNKFLVAESNW